MGTGDQRPSGQVEPTARALFEACVKAACTSNSILSRLFVEGNLATFGYFDALYLFSSTLVLIISAVLEPDASVSDAVQTAFQLLKSMAETGNLPARGYYDRLCCVRNAIDNMRLQALTPLSRQNALEETPLQANRAANGAEVGPITRHLKQRIAPEPCGLGFDQEYPNALTFDALANPFIEEFLNGEPGRWADDAGLHGQTNLGLADSLHGDFLLGHL